jgi:hypothetical protein
MGIGYQSSFEPLRLNPPIQLQSSGPLWTEVGRTALQASDRLSNLPEVYAKSKYDVAQYKAAEDQLAYMKSIGWGRVLTQTGPGGATMIAPGQIADPTTAARITQAMGLTPQVGGGGSGPPPAVNNPATQPQNQGPELIGGQQPAPAPKTAPAPPTTKEMGSASTDNDFLIRRMIEERQAAGLDGSEAAQAGTPPGLTFTNPATGNVQPLQQTAPSMFAGRAATPPAAAPSGPAQAQPPAQPSTPGTVPGSLSDQYAQQQLANWQGQNQGGAASARAALEWAQTNRDTDINRAVYMDHGGPGGQPAFAFYGKKGGSNIVPLQQMVQSGFAPEVVAQNISPVLSQSQRVTSMPSGNGAGATQGSPAAQPTPMPSGTGAGTPQGPPAAPGPPAQYPTIASDQGGPQGAPGTSYNPVPYQQAVAQATANPQNLTAQAASAGQPATVQPAPGQPVSPPPSNDTVPQADQAAIQAKASQMPAPSSGEYQGDRVVPGTTGPYTYYVDDNPKSPWRGRVYTALPGPEGHYFDQQKWYLGTTGYQPYELSDSAARQQMWDKWGTKGYLSRDQIATMPEKDMEPWLQRAWKNETFQRSSPTEGLNSSLTTSEQYHNSLKRISDIIQTLGENGYPNLSARDLLMAKAKNAAVSLGAGPTVPGMDEYAAAAIRDLDEELGHAHDLVKAHPELGITPGKTEGTNLPSIKPAFGVEIPEPNIPGSDPLYDAAYSGRPMNIRLKTLNGLQKQGDARYEDLVNQAQTQWMRIDPRHDANVLKINQGRDIDGNDYQGHTYPSEFPTVKPEGYAAWAKAHPGETFMTPGPNPKKLVAPK